MRMLANENIPRSIVMGLRSMGHDVTWCVEDGAGASDRTVLDRAQQEKRLVVTMDKDFGELAVRCAIEAGYGVVLLRLEGRSVQVDTECALSAFLSCEEWSGQFVVIEADRVRTRPLR